jgi:hypothetical protein
MPAPQVRTADQPFREGPVAAERVPVQGSGEEGRGNDC